MIPLNWAVKSCSVISSMTLPKFYAGYSLLSSPTSSMEIDTIEFGLSHKAYVFSYCSLIEILFT